MASNNKQQTKGNQMQRIEGTVISNPKGGYLLWDIKTGTAWPIAKADTSKVDAGAQVTADLNSTERICYLVSVPAYQVYASGKGRFFDPDTELFIEGPKFEDASNVLQLGTMDTKTAQLAAAVLSGTPEGKLALQAGRMIPALRDAQTVIETNQDIADENGELLQTLRGLVKLGEGVEPADGSLTTVLTLKPEEMDALVLVLRDAKAAFPAEIVAKLSTVLKQLLRME